MKFSPQGVILLGLRDTNGVPGVFFDTGCADDISLSFNIQKWTHTETCSGQHAIDAEGIKSKDASVAMTLTDFNTQNLLLALNGTDNIRAAATSTVTNEVLPTGIIAGQYAILGGISPKNTITAASIVDSAGTPLTLVAGTDYVLDPGSGAIKFINTPGTQPYKANYTHRMDEYVSFLTAGTNEYWLRFNALNTQNANKISIVDLYRVRLDPTSKLDLLPPELATFPLTGSVLIDTTKSATGPLGQFGRISLPV